MLYGSSSLVLFYNGRIDDTTGLKAACELNNSYHTPDITIGDGSQIGHKVILATLNHGIAPEDRGALYPTPNERCTPELYLHGQSLPCGKVDFVTLIYASGVYFSV